MFEDKSNLGVITIFLVLGIIAISVGIQFLR